MNRSELGQHLEAYADGELPAELRPAIQAHLAQNPGSQAEVHRWQALRRSAQRGLAAEPLATGLRERLIEQLATQRQSRTHRTWPVVGTLAAAAVLLLAIFLWYPSSLSDRPAKPPTHSLAANDLAEIYECCACREHHDSFNLAGLLPCDAVERLAARPDVNFAPCIPDLSAAGYRLAGACNCLMRKGIDGIHVHYHHVERPPATDARPGDIVSFFAMACRVRLTGCSESCGGCPHGRHPERSYSVAHARDNVTILKWDECACSFAICTALEQDELLQLVDTVEVAALVPADVASFASAPRPAYHRAVLWLAIVLTLSPAFAR